jgi:pyridoxine 5-phosphate synthase
MAIKLGVNIDHIATLRQARKEVDPDPLAAAKVCKSAGADFIVTHLRQDRRHIQDADLLKLRRGGKFNLHLEMANVPELVRIALKVQPDSVCIVPESPGEVTTQGGLNFRSPKSIAKTVERLKKAGMEVSLFVDPDAGSVRMAKSLGADIVEICSSEYSRVYGGRLQAAELEKIELAGYLANELGLTLHAGHGLDYHNAAKVAAVPHMVCLNIGYSIITRAVFKGLSAAVTEMKKVINAA